jgi:pimeloyl-ACP methyl ester carboxylesterase
VPYGVELYCQDRARDDLLAVLDGIRVDRAHIVGCSMGAFAALHFGMKYCTREATSRAVSLTLAGCGSAAHPAVYPQFCRWAAERADAIRCEGMADFAATYGRGPALIQYLTKDPRDFAEYLEQLSEHSPAGSANTLEGCLARRPCLYDLTVPMAAIDVPVLLIIGDEDEKCLEPCLPIKRTVSRAGLWILPKTGHVVNLEEPPLFNQLLDGFLHQVSEGRWDARHHTARPESIWGPAGRSATA